MGADCQQEVDLISLFKDVASDYVHMAAGPSSIRQFVDRDLRIVMVGDGAMQVLGNDGLVTISKYWKTWSDPRLVVLVLKNLDLNQVMWEQRVMNGDPKFQASQDLPEMGYAAMLLSLVPCCRGVLVKAAALLMSLALPSRAL